MRTTLIALLAGVALNVWAGDVEPGFKALFNGQNLDGWDGNPKFWSVREGVVTGQTTAENPTKGNTFLIWRGGEVSDFELRLSFRIVGGNSGIQYRSRDRGNWVVNGYQGDFEAGTRYSGILYEEGGRGILAQRGTSVWIDGNGEKRVVGSLGDSAEIQQVIKSDDWNEYVIIARGNHLTHVINGRVTMDVTDDQSEKAAKSGILALQLHAGPPMIVQFKNIRLKELGKTQTAQTDLEKFQGDWRPVAFTHNGEDVPADELANIRVTIKGNDYQLEAGDGSGQGSFKLDPSANPKRIDATTTEGDRVYGIYAFEGDTLKVCYSDSSRPSEFSAAAGSDRILAIYKRK